EVQVIGPDEVVRLWESEAGSAGDLLVGSDERDHLELWTWGLPPPTATRQGRTPRAPGRWWRCSRERSRWRWTAPTTSSHPAVRPCSRPIGPTPTATTGPARSSWCWG